MERLSRTNSQSISDKSENQTSHSDNYRTQKEEGLSDPRIDSPEISVVYPSIEVDLPRSIMEEDTVEIEKPEETEQTCDCKEAFKTDWLTTIKENGTHFLLLALVVFILGYTIGKRS